MEQLLFFLVFVLIGLAQLIYRWLSERARQEHARQRPRSPAPRPERPIRRDEEEPWDEERAWEERQRREAARRALPTLVRVDTPGPPPTPTPRAQPLPRPRRRLAPHADLRRAIVLMEILGPCRGVRPGGRRPHDD